MAAPHTVTCFFSFIPGTPERAPEMKTGAPRHGSCNLQRVFPPCHILPNKLLHPGTYQDPQAVSSSITAPHKPPVTFQEATGTQQPAQLMTFKEVRPGTPNSPGTTPKKNRISDTDISPATERLVFGCFHTTIQFSLKME